MTDVFCKRPEGLRMEPSTPDLYQRPCCTVGRIDVFSSGWGGKDKKKGNVCCFRVLRVPPISLLEGGGEKGKKGRKRNSTLSLLLREKKEKGEYLRCVFGKKLPFQCL